MDLLPLLGGLVFDLGTVERPGEAVVVVLGLVSTRKKIPDCGSVWIFQRGDRILDSVDDKVRSFWLVMGVLGDRGDGLTGKLVNLRTNAAVRAVLMAETVSEEVVGDMRLIVPEESVSGQSRKFVP